MTPLSDDDRELVDFLKQHNPQPPATPPELEDQILAALSTSSPPQSLQTARSSRPRYSRLWIPSAIAASLIAGLIGYRTLVPPRSSTPELVTLEAFIEDNWGSAVNDNSENELFPSDLTNN